MSKSEPKTAKYRVLQTSWIDERLVEEGEIVETAIDYDEERDTNLEPLEPKSKARTTAVGPSSARASAERVTDEGAPTKEGGTSPGEDLT